MIEIRLLGSVQFRAPSRERDLRTVLSQPKRLGFLAYLALAGRRGPLRRDTLLGVFWPEASEDRARNSLNQMVFALRRVLGDEVVATRGSDEVELDADAAWCDAVAFERALQEGDARGAVETYGGDLLPGLHVTGSAEFERWLSDERERLRSLAVEAALALVEDQLESNPADAVHWLRRAVAWDPFDERVVRRLMSVLDALGDRSGAVRAYESLQERLRTELDLEPSPESRGLMEEIRAREEAWEESPEPPVRVERPVLRWARSGRRGRVGTAVAAGGAGLVAIGIWLAGSGSPAADAHLDERRILVSAFENRTGDPGLDPVGLMAGDWIAQGLARSGVARVVPFSTVMRETPFLEVGPGRGDGGAAILPLAKEVGARLMVTGAFYQRSDSLLFQTRVVDVATGEVIRAIDAVGGIANDPTPIVNELRARVLGSLAGLMDERLASWGDPASQPPTMDAYREMAGGFDLFMRAGRHPNDAEGDSLFLESAAHFARAGGRDSTFVAPLVWAVYSYLNAGRWEEARRLLAALEGRSDLSEWDRTVLQMQRAGIEGDFDLEFEVAQRLVELSPDSEWLFKLGAAAYASRRYRTAVNAFSRLDPDRGWISGWPAHWHLRIEARHSLGDHARELEDVERLRERFPEDPALLVLESSALAGLGQANEAITRVDSAMAADPAGTLPELNRIAGELRAHGSPAAARALVERGIAIESALPPDVRRDRRLAGLLYLTGRLDESHALLSRLAEADPDDSGIRTALGAIAARRGDRAEAERVVSWLAETASVAPEGRAQLTLGRARIAALLGDRERALDLLEMALESGLRHHYLWFHTLIDLETLRGDPRFQALLRSRDG